MQIFIVSSLWLMARRRLIFLKSTTPAWKKLVLYCLLGCSCKVVAGPYLLWGNLFLTSLPVGVTLGKLHDPHGFLIHWFRPVAMLSGWWDRADFRYREHCMSHGEIEFLYYVHFYESVANQRPFGRGFLPMSARCLGEDLYFNRYYIPIK